MIDLLIIKSFLNIKYGENIEPNERDYEKADEYILGYGEEQWEKNFIIWWFFEVQYLFYWFIQKLLTK